MIISSLNFIRKSLSTDQAHFVSAKKFYISKLPSIVGPFTINPRHAFPLVEEFLKKMEFQKGDVWHYDPKGIISQRRKNIKASTYEHEPRTGVEWKANSDSWPLDT